MSLKPKRKEAMEQATTEELSERVIFPATKTMVEAISDYRFDQRIESKADAIRRLIEAGLKAEKTKGKPK